MKRSRCSQPAVARPSNGSIGNTSHCQIPFGLRTRVIRGKGCPIFVTVAPYRVAPPYLSQTGPARWLYRRLGSSLLARRRVGERLCVLAPLHLVPRLETVGVQQTRGIDVVFKDE